MAGKYFLATWCVAFVVGVGCADTQEHAAAPEQGPAKPQPEAATEGRPQAEDVAAKPQSAERQSTNEANDPQPVRRDPEVIPAAAEEPVDEGAPQRRTAFFRLDATAPAVMPKVVLSKNHEALCKVKVGDRLPDLELPVVGGSEKKKLSALYGKTATVVVFWKGDRRMTRELLADLGPDVIDLFGKQGIAVVGLAVNETPASAKAALDKAGAKFVNLLDADGQAFAQVGGVRLPRVFLVDQAGKILWFDIEYSQTTRRELHQALHAVSGAPPEVPVEPATSQAAKPQAGPKAAEAGK